jgi:hypothetical protein
LNPQQALAEQLAGSAAAADPARTQLLGVALLQLFVQANWAGGPGHNPAVPGHASPPSCLTDIAVEEILVGDSGGDSLVPVARDPWLLAAAKLILVDHQRQAAVFSPLLSALWALRCCLTVQTVLEEKSDTLHSIMAGLVAEGLAAAGCSIEKQQLAVVSENSSEQQLAAAACGEKQQQLAVVSERSSSEQQLAAAVSEQQQLAAVASEQQQGLTAVSESNSEQQLAAVVSEQQQQQLMALFHLERARFHSLYHEVREMVRATQLAGEQVGLRVTDTGALGRRTKYQV